MNHDSWVHALVMGSANALTIGLVTYVSTRYRGLDRIELVLEQLSSAQGPMVRIRPTSFSRYFRRPGTLVAQDAIVQLQYAPVLSLFYRSGAVIDLHVHARDRWQVFQQLQAIWPTLPVCWVLPPPDAESFDN